MKCRNCRKECEPVVVFRHKRDATNKHKGARRPVAWCAECWEAAKKFNAESRAKADAEVERIKKEFGLD